MAGTFQIKQGAGGELRVELTGSLDESLASELEREVLRTIADLTPGSFSATFETAQVTDCAMSARPLLVRIQNALAHKARRTAWLDDRPRFRGLALWVVHVAEDRNAKAVATPEQLRRWLSSDVGRAEDAQARAEGAWEEGSTERAP